MECLWGALRLALDVGAAPACDVADALGAVEVVALGALLGIRLHNVLAQTACKELHGGSKRSLVQNMVFFGC